MEKFPQSHSAPQSPEKSDHTNVRSKTRAFLKTIGLAGLLGSSLLSSENVSAQQNASQKRDTIFTANPADPRITAYKDSLSAYKEYSRSYGDAELANAKRYGPKIPLEEVRQQIAKAYGEKKAPVVYQENGGYYDMMGGGEGTITWFPGGKNDIYTKQGSLDEYTKSTDVKAESFRAILPSKKGYDKGKYDYVGVYKEPVQPVVYKKEAVPDTFSRTPDTYTVYGPNGGLLGSVDQSGVFSSLPASERAHLSDGLGVHAEDKKVLEEWDAGEVPPYLAQQGVKK